MKYSIISLLLIFSLVAYTQAQTIRRVNNTPGINAPFTTIQAAVTAATANDIILVEGSTVAYSGDVLIDKPLRFIGPGYFHNQPNPINQALELEASGATFRLRVGSNGTIIEGFNDIDVFNFTGFSGNPSNIIAVSNLIVRRNRDVSLVIEDLTGQTDIASSNIQMNQNYNLRFSVVRCNNVSVQNNFVISTETSAVNNLTLTNNVMLAGLFLTSRGYGNITINSNATFQNNIIIFSSAGISAQQGSAISASNNICSDTQLPASNGNVQNVSMTNVFIGSIFSDSPTATISTDRRFQLRNPDANNNTPNPAKGGGFNGVDCGMYGGLSPYMPSGIPAIPIITQFNATPSGNNNTPLQVTISIQSNQ
jgi:hypothetical protein